MDNNQDLIKVTETDLSTVHSMVMGRLGKGMASYVANFYDNLPDSVKDRVIILDLKQSKEFKLLNWDDVIE